MGGQRNSLSVLQIAEPCSESWDAMGVSERARFCSHCQKHVHDLSQMTTGEAERLKCTSAGSLCVRFHRGPDGAVMTLDYYQPRPHRRRWLWPVMALVTLATTAAGLFYPKKPAPVPPPTPVPTQFQATMGALSVDSMPEPRPKATLPIVGGGSGGCSIDD